MKNYNIGIFADGKWGLLSIKLFLKNKNFNIQFVCLREKPDLIIYKFCKKNKLKTFIFKNVNSRESYKILKKQKCEIFLSISYDQIFKKNIILIPKKGIINCHASKLPEYRGRNVLNWAIINGEKSIGITTHFINEKIDDGKIIYQKIYKLKKNITYIQLLKFLYPRCSKLLYQSTIDILSNKKINFIDQSLLSTKSFYCRKRTIKDQYIKWNDTSEKINNFIRALCAPNLYALTNLDNKKIKIVSARIIKIRLNRMLPGTIIQKTNKNFIVKTQDSAIKVYKWIGTKNIEAGGKFQ